MAKDISANVELEGGSIEVTPSLSDLTLAADADIHNVVAVKVQSDWNEDNASSGAYIRNKPNVPSLDGYATEDWVEGKGYLTQHQSLTNYATKSWVEDKGYLTEHQSLLGYATEAWVEDQNFIDGLVILEYGTSTWQEAIDAVNANKVVYCKVSAGHDGTWRYAFLAYVNNRTSPYNLEFQYYRSVSSHTASQQGDQVFVYKLDSRNGGTWATTTREASSKIAVGDGLALSYKNGVLTISLSADYKNKIDTLWSERSST